MFSGKFCEIFKNSYFEEHLRTTAFEKCYDRNCFYHCYIYSYSWTQFNCASTVYCFSPFDASTVSNAQWNIWKSKKKYFLYRKRGLAKLNTKRNWLKTLHEKRGKSICHKKSLEKLVVISETIANEYFSGNF